MADALAAPPPLAAADAAVREAVRLAPGARVVAAMSGGVDSTVAAALLKRAGYDVVGVTLQLYDHGAAVKKPGACCAGQDIRDARQAAERIGIPHYVLDYESRFRAQVIDDFADAYLRGETPIPCVRCNQTVKFRDLLDVARELGAEAMATGHYVRRAVGRGGPELHRGADPARDQSYFLFATTADQLDYLRFPLGDLPKPQVRATAAALELGVADKPDSQDICFVPDGKYSTLIDRLRPGAVGEGEIVHMDGRVLGVHSGVSRYTVGQRRGLNVALGEPLFVVALDPAARRVVVGPREALLTHALTMKETNWIGDPLDAGGGGDAGAGGAGARTLHPRACPRPAGAGRAGPLAGVRDPGGRRLAGSGMRALRGRCPLPRAGRRLHRAHAAGGVDRSYEKSRSPGAHRLGGCTAARQRRKLRGAFTVSGWTASAPLTRVVLRLRAFPPYELGRGDPAAVFSCPVARLRTSAPPAAGDRRAAGCSRRRRPGAGSSARSTSRPSPARYARARTTPGSTRCGAVRPARRRAA